MRKPYFCRVKSTRLKRLYPADFPGTSHTQAPSCPVTFTRVMKKCDFNLIEEEKMKGRLICVVALAMVVALPVLGQRGQERGQERGQNPPRANQGHVPQPPPRRDDRHAKPEPERHVTGHINTTRSEEHTSDLQSQSKLVCSLL